MQPVIKQTLMAVFVSWREQFNQRPLQSLSILLVISVIAGLLIVNLFARHSTVDPQFLKWAVFGGVIGALSTALGAAPGLVLHFQALLTQQRSTPKGLLELHE